MRMSNYFKLAEIVKTDTGLDNGLKDAERAITATITATKMDLVRYILGVPVIINSWYRSAEVNKAVGGSPRSQHLEGVAVDFKTKSFTPRQIYKKILDSGISFDQLLVYKTFVHISFNLNIEKDRKEIIDKGGL
ncbi:MAG: D-Ala-D-Ala carboxypeptidase family metallohydrolase [Cetobacterium sp.]|uniref:D-Ala-D-Ala carboxypeptidase family metallohydrolase n=1 Tax=Cetobacterium sp. TaxID=2071632 RepID=UPI003F3C112B